MSEPLCLLTVHAHPDDESSKGPSTVAKYKSQGVRTVLVCCTGGEEGEILNKAVDLPEVRDNLSHVRELELAEAAKIIGYDVVEYLGYRDSGMPDSEANKRPEAFANAPLEEAVERLVRIIRHERPQVIVTYSDNQQGYLHPDHIRVNDISVPAFAAAGDPEAYPDAGEPWTPSKLYYVVWARRRFVAMEAKYQELGIESPFGKGWADRPSLDHEITTSIDVAEHFAVRGEALRAHATQVDPESPFWFGLPDDAQADAYPYEDYVLAECRIETSVPEDDLFAGLRRAGESS